MCSLYFTSNCRYRVINKIHPCLSHANSFFLNCLHVYLVGVWAGGSRRWEDWLGLHLLPSRIEHLCSGVFEEVTVCPRVVSSPYTLASYLC